MTPKEKAEEIIKKIFNEQHTDTGAKMIMLSTPKIAFMFVDEMLRVLRDMNPCVRMHKTAEGRSINDQCQYWFEVKKEMELFFK